jgi:hypothetical protein
VFAVSDGDASTSVAFLLRSPCTEEVRVEEDAGWPADDGPEEARPEDCSPGEVAWPSAASRRAEDLVCLGDAEVVVVVAAGTVAEASTLDLTLE